MAANRVILVFKKISIEFTNKLQECSFSYYFFVKLSYKIVIGMDPKHGVIKGQQIVIIIFCNFVECVGEYTTLPLPEIQKTCAILMVSLLYHRHLRARGGVYSLRLSVCMFVRTVWVLKNPMVYISVTTYQKASIFVG